MGTVCPPGSSKGGGNEATPGGPSPDAAAVTLSVSTFISGQNSPEPSEFVGDLLLDAVEETRRRIIKSLTECAVTEADVDIPRDAAKFWIKSKLQRPQSTGLEGMRRLIARRLLDFIDFAQEDFFSSLVDNTLLRLLPDIIGLPHIHVDATMTLIYYCTLYHGASLSRIDSNSGPNWCKNSISVVSVHCQVGHVRQWARWQTSMLLHSWLVNCPCPEIHLPKIVLLTRRADAGSFGIF